VTTPTRNRHTTRLPGYDYTQPGGYYVTIVTHGREPVLGAVVDGTVVLATPGVIVQQTWRDLPHHFANVMLDEFVIMPNHVHGIVMITDGIRIKPDMMDGNCRGEASGNDITGEPTHIMPDASPLPHGTQRGSLGAILQNFKSISARRINAMQNTSGQPFWQRNYHEHVIRNETDLQIIRQYIHDNPSKWELDEENQP